VSTSSASAGAAAAPRRATYRRALWLLTKRDLAVRYSTSALGYLWSIIDPLVMAFMYWFVFGVIFQRPVGEEPYVVFLLTGLLPWMWFNGAVGDSTRAFLHESKLIRSTRIPRSIWVSRLVLSKGIEFLASIPVLATFAIFTGATAHWEALLAPIGIVIQAMLTLGVGLIVAPLVVLFRDLERAVRLVLRVLFYATPIVYGLPDLAAIGLQGIAEFNPLAGIISLYRSAFFPEHLDWSAVGVSAALSAILLVAGILVMRRCERAVLKEL
jgi:ABC-2 type transport system permease protein